LSELTIKSIPPEVNKGGESDDQRTLPASKTLTRRTRGSSLRAGDY
jgi:hypothetical protein